MVTICRKRIALCEGMDEFDIMKNELSGDLAILPDVGAADLSIQKTCPTCSKPFGSEKALRRHYVRAHPGQLDTVELCKPSSYRSKSIDCSLCEQSARSYPALFKHFTDIHGLSMKEEAHDFMCSADFLKWKQEVEKDTKSLFVKVRGTTPLKCVRGKKDVYVCHRSGKCRSKLSDRARHRKSQGSQKLNAFCPARMKVVVTEGDRVFLNFQPTHVGHSFDAVHLRLTQSEKETIAKKMETKIPMDQILQEIKDTPSLLGRLKLLSKQDLYNISRESSVLTTVYSGCETPKWVDEPRRRSCILLFKPRGSPHSDFPDLEIDDFMLCLLNDQQKHLFNKSDCVSLDSFEATSPSEYNLFCVASIIGKTASPCALFISNRKDSAILEQFLRTVKSSTGTITPHLVFHERNSILFDAWKIVFNDPSVQLFGSWHVDYEWRGALSKLVKSVRRKPEIYKRLRSLMEKPRIPEFNDLLKEVTGKTLVHDESREFETYFRGHFMNCPSSWARCYRSSKTSETNVMFEKLYRSVKSVYTRFKMQKTVYKMGDLLLDIIDQCVTGVASKNAKLKDIRTHHRMAVDARMSVDQEDDCSWRVSEPQDGEMGTQVVEKRDISCQCRMRCSDCDCCAHAYCCTCFDSDSRRIMCKHIHAVCLWLVSSESGDAKFNSLQQSTITNHDIVVKTVSVENLEVVINDGITNESVEEGKVGIQEDFNTILSMITTAEDVNLVKNAFRLILPTLCAMKNANNLHSVVETAEEISTMNYS